MERYSTLYGTKQAGPYERLGSSKRLGNFLTQKIGAADIKGVVELTEKLIAGIDMLPGYENETLINKPLAVVYAPLYLEKKPGMTKGMKGFCALAVSGLEHRPIKQESGHETRETRFSHTWFFSREDMLREGEFNYLDLLMGTQLTTSRDVDLHREGSLTVNLDRLPQKVHPTLVEKDLGAVFMTIDALYQKKDVVLVVEPGVNFNRRSMELLTQIYSMMQPVMATETGFATYQTQKRILEMSADTNIQIYVVPAGTDLSALPANKFEILDLADGVTLRRTPVTETLNMWRKLDWKTRSRSLAHMFGGSSDYSNAEQFVKLSHEFISQVQALNAWAADTSKNKTITTMAQIQAEDKTESDWKLVPWARETFEKKIPDLLKDTSVDVLNARNIAVIYEYNGTDAELKERSIGTVDRAALNNAALQYQYGRKLAGANEGELCRLIWEKADERVGVGYRAQLQAKDDEIAARDKKFDDRENEFKTAWEKQKQIHEAALTRAVEVEKANTAAVQAKLDTADQVHAQQVDALNQQHQTAVDNLNQQHRTAMNDLQQKAQDKISEYRSANETLNNNLTQANADKQNLQNSLTQANNDKQTLQNNLTQANNDKQTLQNNLTQAITDKQTLQNKLAQSDTEKQTLQNERDQVKSEYNELLRNYKQATGQERPEPVLRFGPFTLHKSGVSLLAVTAAVMLLLGGLLGVLVGGLFEKEPEVYAIAYAINDQTGSDSVTLSHTEAEAGETITVIVDPAEGWQIDEVRSQSGTAVTKVSDTQYTFVMAEKNENIFVSVSKIPVSAYPVNWTVNGKTGDTGEMGSVALSRTEAEAGETITATVVPSEGWLFEDIKCTSGTEITVVDDTNYTFVMAEQAETVEITLAPMPTEPEVIGENGVIDWEAARENVSWIATAETDPKAVKKTLGKAVVTSEGWTTEALLLSEGWDAAENKELPPYVLVLSGDEAADTLELLAEGDLVLDNGEKVLLVRAPKTEDDRTAWNKAVRAALNVADLLCGTEDQLETFGYMLADGRVLDLHTAMADAGMPGDWWLDLNKLSTQEKDQNDVKFRMGAAREVILVIDMVSGPDGGILDYFDDPAKGDTLVSISQEKDRSAAHVQDFVLVMLNGTKDAQ